MITVISTGFASTSKARCLESVRAQKGVTLEHVYIEASTQAPPRTKMQNLAEAIGALPSDRLVALVDGDDWLAHDRALASSARIYEEHPETLLTYGSFARSDGGNVNGCSEYPEAAKPRVDVWRASHLKTFRAGLFHRIQAADLRMPDGQWIAYIDDFAFMIPMLEMAGPDRARFNRETIYVYNMQSPLAFYRIRANVEACATVERHVRALPPYERIDSL